MISLLNIIWPFFIIVSFSYAILSGNIDELNNIIFKSTNEAIELCIGLLGTMCFWSGIIQIANSTKIIDSLNKRLNPVINFLFPSLKNNKKIQKEIAMNMTANILGLGNAATPLGIKAMKSMQEKNENKERISSAMMMFIVINTASIQIIPTTVIAIRNSLNSKNPTEIIIPVWIATIFAAITRDNNNKNTHKNS